MKATLEYDMNDPEEKDQLRKAIDANKYLLALQETHRLVFRTMYKHGYSDSSINELIDKNPKDSQELISKLEDIFNNILDHHMIDIY